MRWLWLRGRAPPWPALADALGAVVDVESDVTSMRAVRSAVMTHQPEVILYAGWRDAAENEAERAFTYCAEAVIGVAAAALELGAVFVFLSHPAVFGFPGAHDEAVEPRPGDVVGEAWLRGETFALRAARAQTLIVRAEPQSETEQRNLACSLRGALKREARGVLHVPSAGGGLSTHRRFPPETGPSTDASEGSGASTKRLWSEASGRPPEVELAPGVRLHDLAPGSSRRLAATSTLTVLSGKVVLSIGDRDEVLRAGHQAHLASPAELAAVSNAAVVVAEGRAGA